MRWHIVLYVVNAFFLYYSNNMNHLFEKYSYYYYICRVIKSKTL